MRTHHSALTPLALTLLLAQAWTTPLREDMDMFPRHPLTAVSELNSRVAARVPRLGLQDSRLMLPTLQELEAIKKVAQILVMLGEQVIPAIINEPPPSGPSAVVDEPNDEVHDDQ